MEYIQSGWLRKSPPEKRIWRGKWRKRWFILRQSGQIPGQYVLQYYTDESYKKLKGHIDLDQCEQVDIGVTLDEENRKDSYEYVFDIRTPKRTYYLVADTETEMNKWVECICSVCGLKLYNNELDVPIPEPTVQTVERQPSPTPSSTLNSTLTRNDTESLASISISESSVAYIPISECHTGTNPLINGYPLDGNPRNYTDSHDDVFPDQVPPPPPKGIERCKKLSAEFYDYPRQIHPPSLNEMKSLHETTSNELQRLTQSEEDDWSAGPSPPKVNWDTYPRGCDSEAMYANRRSSETCDQPQMPSTNSEDVTGKMNTLSLNESYSDSQRYESSKALESSDLLSQQGDQDSSSSFSSVRIPIQKPPPRPPKPAYLKETQSLNRQNGLVPRNNYINYDNYDNYANCDQSLYDVPPSAQGVYLSKNLPASAFAYLKDSSVDCVPSGTGQYSADDMYDFPRPLHDDQLNATPPAPTGESIWQRRHCYSNAPALLMVDGDTNNNNSSEEYLNMGLMHQPNSSDIYTAMSGDGHSPSSQYSNLPSPLQKNDCVFILTSTTPPAVNRSLKPGRQTGVALMKVQQDWKSNDVNLNVLPSAPVVDRGLKPKRIADGRDGSGNVAILSPQPTGAIHPIKNKRSFRKPRASPSPNPLSPHNRTIYANATLSPNSRTYDKSSSDDDQSSSCSSRRNSSNDDHVATKQTKSPSPRSTNRRRNESEVQYLDLDHSEAPAPSPKSPEKLTTNTVYKTVDFVKTDAFNRMRQNVEATYRKSQ